MATVQRTVGTRGSSWLGFAFAALLALLAVTWWRCSSDAPLVPGPVPRSVDHAAAKGPGAAESRRTEVDTTMAPLRGTVVDRDGAPVVQAEVSAVVLASGANISLRTDAAGAFSFAVLPEGELRLVVVHPEFVVLNAAVADTARGDARLVLQRRPVLRGRALDAATGAPLPLFVVALLPLPEGTLFPVVDPPPTAIAVRDADGRFLLLAEQGGPHAVAVFTKTGAPTQVLVQLANDRVSTCEVRVVRGVRVRGRVRDASGLPVADASVTLRCMDGAVAGAATLADGSFAFAPLPPGSVALLVQPVAQPFLSIEPLLLEAADPEPFLELQLPKGAEIRGTVVPWRPGQLAEVELRHEQGPVRRVAVDPESGSFAANDLTPGRHRIHVERTEPVWRSRVARVLHLETATKEVDLSATETARVVVDDQTAALARVRGRVDGRIDLATVVVRAFREDEPMPANYEGLLRGTPQADGAFEIDGLVAGRWRLQVMRGDDVLHWQVLAVEPAADVEVLLRVR